MMIFERNAICLNNKSWKFHENGTLVNNNNIYEELFLCVAWFSKLNFDLKRHSMLRANDTIPSGKGHNPFRQKIKSIRANRYKSIQANALRVYAYSPKLYINSDVKLLTVAIFFYWSCHEGLTTPLELSSRWI